MGLACISVDLDTLACYRDIHGLRARERGSADAAYAIGVRRLLEFFDEEKIPATLFVIGRDLTCEAHADILREAAEDGHELASHSDAHDYALRHRPIATIREDLRRADAAIAEVAGRRPVGFRTPGYNVSPEILEVCRELGYRYDSSVFPCPPYYLAKGAVMGWMRLRGRPSRSSMTLPQTLLAPMTPYRPHPRRLWRAGGEDGSLLEIPMCVVPGTRFPIIGTSLHLMRRRGFDLAYPLLRRAHRELFNLEFHAIDFMDCDDLASLELVEFQPDLQVPWKAKRRRYRHVLGRLREDYDFAPLAEASRALGRA